MSDKRLGNRLGAQSRQSANLFLQSSELGLPHPLTHSDEDTHCGTQGGY
jgi:hypothetical protein